MKMPAIYSALLPLCLIIYSVETANAAAIADTIPTPLTAAAGNPTGGRAIVTNRTVGLCLLCHPASFSEQTSQGNLAPSLDGVGSRYTAAQLRLRIVDSRRLNKDSIMPSYYRVAGLIRQSSATQNKPIFDAQQIEDIVAFLVTLK